MSHPITGIDHCFILVNTLDKSARHYARLGFTLSPKGLHSKDQGSANYTIMFANDYLELLGIVENTPANRDKREQLSQYGEGLYAIAGRIDNAASARQELLKLGFHVSDIAHFSRPLPLPDGQQGIASFNTLSFDKSEVPNGIVFICQHNTKQLVWRPELLHHENGALGIAAISIISQSPEHTAKAYARLFANSDITKEHDAIRIHTGKASADILVLTDKAIQEKYPSFDLTKTPQNAYAALSILVENLDKTKSVLTENKVDFHETPQHSLALSPDFTSGVVIEFVSAS